MPDDPVAQVLRLVAEGRLTAEEAAPILDAIEQADRAAARAPGPGLPPPPPGAPAPPLPPSGRPSEPRFARVEVRDGGRTSVNLRIPLSLGRQALGMIPGLSWGQVAELHEAVGRGLSGPIVDIQDEAGDGVRIVLE